MKPAVLLIIAAVFLSGCLIIKPPKPVKQELPQPLIAEKFDTTVKYETDSSRIFVWNYDSSKWVLSNPAIPIVAEPYNAELDSVKLALIDFYDSNQIQESSNNKETNNSDAVLLSLIETVSRLQREYKPPPPCPPPTVKTITIEKTKSVPAQQSDDKLTLFQSIMAAINAIGLSVIGVMAARKKTTPEKPTGT